MYLKIDECATSEHYIVVHIMGFAGFALPQTISLHNSQC